MGWVDAGGGVGGCVIIDSYLWSMPARDLSSSTRLGKGGSGGHLGIICDHLGIIWESFESEVGVNLELKPTRMTYSFFCLLLCGETTAGSQ